MKKRDYYLACIRNRIYAKRDWVISVFAVVDKRPTIPEATYAYQIVCDPADPDKLFAMMPTENGLVSTLITDSDMRLPLYVANEPLDIVDGEIQMPTGDINTTYGIILGNMYLLYTPFGNKFKFINGEIPENITDKIRDLLTDDVAPGVEERHDRIYVREYLKFGVACDRLSGFDTLFTFSGSPKLLTVDPGVLELRDKLIAENRDKLHDPRIQSEIEEQVVAADKASFKGDPAEKFLISGKSFNPTRKKRLIMIGGSAGFGGADGGKATFIPSSLRDGWKLDDIPSHVNDARAGSYFRGKETALGGTDVILATRMGMNTRIEEKFCGATTGLKIKISKEHYKKYYGLYLVNGSEPLLLTPENISQYEGKTVSRHSPAYCKVKGDAYCRYCIGDGWSLLRNGVNNVLSNIGDVFMNDRMKRMHGKALKTANYVFINFIR